jgi:hypothetical protein
MSDAKRRDDHAEAVEDTAIPPARGHGGFSEPGSAPGSCDTITAPRKPSDLAQVVGSGLAAFKSIILPTDAQRTAVRQMDSLRIMGLQQPEGQQRRAYRYLNHSGAGKSTCATILKDHVNAQPGRDPALKPVLHVTLSTTGTPKSFASSILDAMGDNYSTRGEAELLLRRVRHGIREFGVELLIIDEMNHFRHKSMAKDAANTIKNILTLGWVPVVLMGTPEAQALFTDNRELKNRCAPQVVLSPYDVDDDVDLARWSKFLQRLDSELVKRDILTSISGLAEPDLAADLCRASNGLIGELHNILLAALEQVLLAGEKCIGHQRLVDAVDAWCMQDATIDRNYVKLRYSEGLRTQRQRSGGRK